MNRGMGCPGELEKKHNCLKSISNLYYLVAGVRTNKTNNYHSRDYNKKHDYNVNRLITRLATFDVTFYSTLVHT